MLSLLIAAFLTPAHAACSLEGILQTMKPAAKCVQQYLQAIPNAQDREAAKFRLGLWRPIKDLHVTSVEGMIEASRGEQVFLRTILLQKQRPMLLYMNGKIVVDNSENPSFARRLENALKNTSAWNFLPEANAQQETASTQANHDLTLFYALDNSQRWADPQEIVKLDSQKLRGFLPAPSWLMSHLSGANKLQCTSNDTVEATTFKNPDSSVQTADLQIIPRTPTEFIVRGFRSNETYLLKINSWNAEQMHRKGRVISPGRSADEASFSLCADQDCAKIKSQGKLKDYNFPLRLNPEQEQASFAKRIKANQDSIASANAGFQNQLTDRVFGLSVMGSCCGNTKCRDAMLNAFAIDLQSPASNSPTVQ